MQKRLAIIGGTALQDIDGLEIIDRVSVKTPYGRPSSDLVVGELGGIQVVFLTRHGRDHKLAPHKINYCANVWALHSLKVSEVIAVASVGGITNAFGPACLAVPDQLIDYTFGRINSFYEDDFNIDKHIDFTEPYNPRVRDKLLAVADQLKLKLEPIATMGITQGPRLETATEIKRMQQDGCDLVGMTGMPEAVLARELNMSYASLAVIVNWAAGVTDELVTIDNINAVIKSSNEKLAMLLKAYCQQS